MERCTYTWKEYDWKKSTWVTMQCPENQWHHAKEYCIFHDPSQEKDTNLFVQKLEEKLNNKDYTFQGFWFPVELNFDNKEFSEKVSFSYATFQKNVSFKKVVFKEVDFRGAVFKEAYFQKASFQKTYFMGAKFQKANFIRATFQADPPGIASFADAVFQKAYFTEAVFNDQATFSKAVFKTAYFSEAVFQRAYFAKAVFGDVNFDGTTFGNAVFRESTFKNATFKKTKFYSVTFSGAVIEKNLTFVPEHMNHLDLQNTQFFFRGYITADLTRAEFHGADLSNVAFINCVWPDKIYEEAHMDENRLSSKELETIYRDLKQNMQNHGNYTQSGEFYYREMEMRRTQYTLLTPQWLGHTLLRILCGYGEKPMRVIGISLFIILVGAAFFFFYGIARVDAGLLPEESPYIIDYSLNSLSFNRNTLVDFGYCAYYSVVTFTTLGYGDIHPLGHSHIVASLEAFTGAFFMALFIFVFGRKMTR
jgi:uncharacterized protein YjbI with pentapeptide repeats